jgi:hypothetical protein
MCAYKRKTWIEKRDLAKEPEVKKSPSDFADIKAGEKMLIPSPLVVDTYIRQIPRGKQGNLSQMRKDLAAEYHAHKTCPITSGIFIRIVSEAAYEEFEQGKAINKITPFWRMVDEKSPAAKKLSFGIDFLSAQRKKEGLSVK